jgi:hypothetical protein
MPLILRFANSCGNGFLAGSTIRPMFIFQTPPVPPATTQYWNAQQWGNAAQWASAILASLAICFALFKEGVLSWFWHPKLTVRLNPEYPDCVKTPLKHGEWWGARYWIRLWIRNEGRVRAQKVEVFLARAWVERKADYWAELPHFTPMNLRWSYGNWKHPTQQLLSLGIQIYCLCQSQRKLDLVFSSNFPGLPKSIFLPGNTDSRFL